MSTYQWDILLAALITAVAVYLLGWQSSSSWHDRQATRRQRAADARTAAARGHLASSALLADRTAPMPTLAGWVEGTRWADWRGAQDRQYQAPAPLDMGTAWELADAAYTLGQGRATADETHAESEAIWAEVEANPQLWRHQ